MRFWDASAIIPLLTAGATTRAVQALAAKQSSLEIVSLDERLAAAARKEGFALVEIPSTE